MSREYPERPILAVGAVVVRGVEVLLVRRGKEPGLGSWSIPGGAVRLGEPLEDAVRRELREETGLKVRPLAVVKVVERIFPEGGRIRYHYVIVDYACTVAGGRLRAASDAAEARWVPYQALDALGLPGETFEVLRSGWQLVHQAPREAEGQTTEAGTRPQPRGGGKGSTASCNASRKGPR